SSWLGLLTPPYQPSQDKTRMLETSIPQHDEPSDNSSLTSFVCDTCGKWYGSRHTLRRHLRLECGKDPQYQCPFCPKKTKQKYNIFLHISRAHRNSL
ncbi:hypothetical protein L9F63_012186, partial [Diploptera punctata]